MRGCLGRIVPIFVIAVLALWLLRSPESAAGLIVSAAGLAGQSADALSRFVNTLAGGINGLL